MSIIIPRTERINYGVIFKLSHRNAERRNIPFSLSRKQFDNLVMQANGQCMVSGITFSAEKIPGASRRPFMPSLDRIDSSRGYTVKNVRLVCVLINIAMNEWGLNPLIRIAQALVERTAITTVSVKEPLVSSTEDTIEYQGVAEYLVSRYGFAPQAQTVQLSHVARRYCETNGIQVQTAIVKKKQRSDGTWSSRIRNAYPLTILKTACDELFA